MVITHKNRFKIKRIGSDSNISKLTELYGGSIVTDLRNLEPNELWYYTNCDMETLKTSGLVEVLGLFPPKKGEDFKETICC